MSRVRKDDLPDASEIADDHGISGERRRPPVVLVVDDDGDLRELCCHRFAMLGCRVLSGANGEDAVRIATLSRPDLILIDLLMPGTDGVEATHRLRSDERTRDLRIAGMTNFGPNWQQVARTAGCDVVLKKAELLEDFEGIARRLLAPGHRRAVRTP